MNRIIYLTAVSFIAPSAFAQVSDVTPPALESFSITPRSIDTRANAQTVTFTLEVSDDLAGTNSVGVVIEGPNNQWRGVNAPRTTGTAMRGTYVAILNFPQFSSSGEWRLNTIQLYDLAGNSSFLSAETVAARGFPASITVVSTPDVTPPRLESLQFTPSSVDTSASDVSVNVRMRLTDTQTGVGLEIQAPGCECIFQVVTLVSPTGRQQHHIPNGAIRMISGTRNDGIWEGSVTMPRYSESGFWTAFVELYDSARNRAYLPPASIAALGLTNGIQVTSSLPDLDPPTLTRLSLNPSVIDTSLTSQTISVTFGIRDNRSGVDLARQIFCPCEILGVDLKSPSGNQRVFTGFSEPFTQVSGTPLEGVWTTTLTFPRYAEAGTWSVDVLLRDRNHNLVRMSRPNLENAGLQASVIVYRRSYVPDGTIEPTGGSVTDDVFGSRARITVPPGALPARTTISIDVLEAPPNIPVPQGFNTPATRFVNIDLIPHPMAGIGPPGYTITIPLAGALPVGTVLELFRLDPISGNLIRARGVTAAPVTGTVDPGGQSATFTGISSFSMIVGLIPTGPKPGDLNEDGVVSCLDMSIVRAAFGKRVGQPGFDPRADVNRDGLINISDLAYVLRHLPQATPCQ